MTWFEALTDGRAWNEQRDAERIAAGFRALVRTVRRWPTPAELLDVLPPSGEKQLQGPGEKPADPQWLKDSLAENRRRMQQGNPVEVGL